jgi:hypothetical protein
MEIEEMDERQLRTALNAENCRIEGVNSVRKTVQMCAVLVAIVGTIIIIRLVHPAKSQDCLGAILLAGCAIVYWRSKPKPLHHFSLYDDGWEDQARAALKQARWDKMQRDRIERESNQDDS